jgi:hypothetical protein
MRKPNYRFERAERDRAKQAKKQEKAKRREQDREAQQNPSEAAAPEADDRSNPPLGDSLS